MANPSELTEKFWKALKSDRTVMLGLNGVEDGHARPMTGQFEDNKSPIWFFTSIENGIVKALANNNGKRAIADFASKGHDLFATLHGDMYIDNNPAVIDRLWNNFIAAWYEGGKTDPKVALLRFDAQQAEIWIDASSLVAGIKMMIGIDPKQDYKDKVGKVNLP